MEVLRGLVYSCRFDGDELTNGFYFIRLTSSDPALSRLLKKENSEGTKGAKNIFGD